jgi:tetratricopeptide (TPR) repeat protein
MRHTLIIKALGAGFCLCLASCAPDERLSPIGEGPSAKNPQVSRSFSNVDGLIVGHRLMAAGEYDLALRSYYRAAADHGINADVLTAIGSANLKLGRLGQAEDMLRRAIKQDQRFVPALNKAKWLRRN